MDAALAVDLSCDVSLTTGPRAIVEILPSTPTGVPEKRKPLYLVADPEQNLLDELQRMRQQAADECYEKLFQAAKVEMVGRVIQMPLRDTLVIRPKDRPLSATVKRRSHHKRKFYEHPALKNW